jgi:hypothetical protein
MEPALASLRRRDPAAARRVRVHETGAAPPSLHGVGAVLFWLADPLLERHGPCHAEAASIAVEARERGIALVNPPEALSRAVKSRQAALWRDAGIDTPPVVRVETAADLRRAARELGFPLLVRSDEEHAQAGARVLSDEAALGSTDLAALPLPAAASPLWDVREGWRSREPRSVYARLHHKKRAYVLGDRVRTEHVFFSRDPVVGAATATFASIDRLPRWLHGLARRTERDTIAEDLAHWRRGEDQADVLLRAAGALGLGFCAIDYAQRAEGTAVLWEANPHPSLPPLRRFRLPGQRLARERLASYHDAVADYLRRLLDAAPREVAPATVGTNGGHGADACAS